MKLILNAIKAMFRRAERDIKKNTQNVDDLTKKVTDLQNALSVTTFGGFRQLNASLPYKEQVYTIYIPEQDFPKLLEEFLHIAVSWSNPDLVGIKVMLKTDDNNYKVGGVFPLVVKRQDGSVENVAIGSRSEYVFWCLFDGKNFVLFDRSA